MTPKSKKTQKAHKTPQGKKAWRECLFEINGLAYTAMTKAFTLRNHKKADINEHYGHAYLCAAAIVKRYGKLK